MVEKLDGGRAGKGARSAASVLAGARPGLDPGGAAYFTPAVELPGSDGTRWLPGALRACQGLARQAMRSSSLPANE